MGKFVRHTFSKKIDDLRRNNSNCNEIGIVSLAGDRNAYLPVISTVPAFDIKRNKITPPIPIPQKRILNFLLKEVCGMYMISINADKCEGCGECVDACPAGILGMVDAKAEVTGAETDCMGCETCVVTCPNEACSLQEL